MTTPARRDTLQTELRTRRVRPSIWWLAVVAGVASVSVLGCAFGVESTPTLPPASPEAVVISCPRLHFDFCDVCLSMTSLRPGAATRADEQTGEAALRDVQESALHREVFREWHPTHSWVSSDDRMPSDTLMELERRPELRARLRTLLESGDLDVVAVMRALSRPGADEPGPVELDTVREKLGISPARTRDPGPRGQSVEQPERR